VAAWVVLLSELAPCITGQLISPIKVTADALGVAMAAAADLSSPACARCCRATSARPGAPRLRDSHRSCA
jgi:hypothetical protein